MDNPCFFDGKGVYYEDESYGKVYILSPYIMREITQFGYVTRDDVLETISCEVKETLFSIENDLRDNIGHLESQVSELQKEVKRLKDIVVSCNIQSEDVELAGFFDGLDDSE